MKKGLAPRHGMVTETGRAPRTSTSPPSTASSFGGWDLRADNVYDAAVREEIVPRHLLDQVKEELAQIKPWPGVASAKFLASMAGKHMVRRQELPRRDRHHHQEPRGLQEGAQARARGDGEPDLDREVHRSRRRPPDHRGLREGARQERRAHQPGDEVPLRRHQAGHAPRQLHAEPLEDPGAGEARRAARACPSRARTARPARRCSRPCWPRPSPSASCRSRAGTRPTSWATTTARCSTIPRATRPRSSSKLGVLDQHPRLQGPRPPGAHPLLQAPRRREGSLGQHRPRRLPRRAHADQGELPLQGLDPGGPAGRRPGPPARRGQAPRRAPASSASSRCSSRRRTTPRASRRSTTCSSQNVACSRPGSTSSSKQRATRARKLREPQRSRGCDGHLSPSTRVRRAPG